MNDTNSALQSEPGSREEASVSKGKARTILLVDDDPSVRDSLRSVLAAEGYEVLTAASVTGAVQRLSKARVDMIVTDLRMPKVSGLDLLFHYYFQRPKLPIFVITALPLEVCQGAEKVADAFFQKPIDLEAFLEAIRQRLAS